MESEKPKLVVLQSPEQKDRATIQQGVIDMLEDLLARAKQGEIDEIIVGISLRDGTLEDKWSGSMDRRAMLGWIEVLKYRFMSWCVPPATQD